MGADGGYTQEDVREVARCFTGWRFGGFDAGLDFGRFVFDAAQHDDDAKVVLGESIPAGGGIADGERVLDIGSGGSVNTAITAIDTAINSVSATRGQLGATINRLNSTISNLAIQSENLSAAESRIRDVDVASETAKLTRNSILQQAAISILSQANVQPQSALSLLG